MRALVTVLLPLLLPTLLYLGWLGMARQRPPEWREAPWIWALLAGVALAIAALGIWGLEGEAPGGRYVPPTLKDGVIVPGHVER